MSNGIVHVKSSSGRGDPQKIRVRSRSFQRLQRTLSDSSSSSLVSLSQLPQQQQQLSPHSQKRLSNGYHLPHRHHHHNGSMLRLNGSVDVGVITPPSLSSSPPSACTSPSSSPSPPAGPRRRFRKSKTATASMLLWSLRALIAALCILLILQKKTLLEATMSSQFKIKGGEALAEDSTVSLDKPEHPEIHILFYETSTTILHDDILPLQQAKRAGIPVSVIGTGLAFQGYGEKWTVVREALPRLMKQPSERIDADKTLIVVTDTRDILLNFHHNFSQDVITEVLDTMKKSFRQVTEGYPEAVVFGSEIQCCVEALTHVTPGAYFDATPALNRKQRACKSKTPECKWGGTDKIVPWVNFQLALALERTRGVEVTEAFLNAGMVMGTANNLMNMIDMAQMEDTEDDQAVLTDLMYRRPDIIMLDYFQHIFGNARFTLSGMPHGGNGCNFEPHETRGNLQHAVTGVSPLFLHTPNRFYQCLDDLAETLGEERSEAYRNLAGPPLPTQPGLVGQLDKWVTRVEKYPQRRL